MRSILSVISTAKKTSLQVSVPYIVDGEAAEKKFSIPRGTAVRLSEKKERNLLSSMKACKSPWITVI